MREVSIRTASLDDAPAIAYLMSQLGYSTSADEMKERLRDILSTESYMTFVAEIWGEVVGMVGIGIGYYYEKNGVYGRLLALVIDETYRRKGIGASLVERAESWLRERKVISIVVNSSKHRSEAHCFYKRLGYEETGLRFVKSLLQPPNTSLHGMKDYLIVRFQDLSPSGEFCRYAVQIICGVQ